MQLEKPKDILPPTPTLLPQPGDMVENLVDQIANTPQGRDRSQRSSETNRSTRMQNRRLQGTTPNPFDPRTATGSVTGMTETPPLPPPHRSSIRQQALYPWFPAYPLSICSQSSGVNRDATTPSLGQSFGSYSERSLLSREGDEIEDTIMDMSDQNMDTEEEDMDMD